MTMMITLPKNAQRDVNCYKVLVTPELCSEWLNSNPMNRPLNERRVNNIARLMKEGKWKDVGQPIILGEHVVLDGQHRLQAIIRSGIAQTMSVVFNQDESGFMNLDCGSPRSKLDMVRVGLQDQTIKSKHLSVLKTMVAGDSCENLQELTAAELMNLFTKYRDSIEFAIALLGKDTDNTVLGVIARACRRLPQETLHSFASAWKQGTYKPLVEFRQYMSQLTDRQLATRRDIYKRCEFVLEAFINNRETVLTTPYLEEMFPLSE